MYLFHSLEVCGRTTECFLALEALKQIESARCVSLEYHCGLWIYVLHCHSLQLPNRNHPDA